MVTRVESGPSPPSRPTGTVTFLFSDIEGSTSRWERDRDAMAAAVARHDALTRTAIEQHGGYIFKTIGDAFCAAFATPPQAIGAALDAQRALLAEDFSGVDELLVRMAVHTGFADERDGDYFGPAVNRVARLLAIGHGGQVLVSGTATDLLQGEMPPQSSLRDLGAHRLKDLARPEQVYQLIAPDLPETFPALRSLDELPNNLPRQLTSFVGRDDVLREIASLIQTSPLVTLVGTGGAGKTRCALQVGADVLDGSGDGVWVVELAPIADRSLVTSAIARALSVQEAPNRPLLETLLTYLKHKRLLLILDNCEHVIGEVRNVAAAILHGCPEVHILATSREGLNIAGERVFRMPSLPAPPANHTLSSQEALQYGAVALFADRALAADGRFTLSDENAPFVGEICRRLDGIPLAIELAAARVKVLSPQQLALKLDERFRVLTGGDRSALPRQQTMRALIDWSYDLLANEERALFRKLSVFAGGFTLETASAVCGDSAMDEIAVLDLLSSLVDKSLVHVEPAGSGTRYRLLESTRQYAREKLRECGEEEATARAHATAFLALGEQLDRSYETTPDRAWLMQAEPELENWRAALVWTFSEPGDVLLGQRIAGGLLNVWSFFGAAEGRRWSRVGLAAVDAATPAAVVGKLYLTEAAMNIALVHINASNAAAAQAMARYRDFADPIDAAQAQRYAGLSMAFLGRIAEGEALLTEALAAARALGAQKLTFRALENLAMARLFSGDVAAARKQYAEALAIARAVGVERQVALLALNMAETEFCAGDALTAMHVASQALAAAHALNDTLRVSTALSNMAAYLISLDRCNEARTHAREAFLHARDRQFDVLVAFLLQHFAAVAALRRDHEAEHGSADRARAARLLGYSDARLSALDAQRQYTEQQEYDRVIAALRDALGEDELTNLMNEGRTWSEEQAVAEAMLI